MKKLLIIIICLVFSVVPVCADKQPAQRDTKGQVSLVAPKANVSITANTAISTDYYAIEPSADVQAYYDSETTNTFTITEGRIFPLPIGRTLSLATTTSCLVY